MQYIKRLLSLPLTESFFLFGARNTGKSTLLRETFSVKDSIWINLLRPSEEERYTRNPSTLRDEVLVLHDKKYVVIDEIQKIPKLLDVIHDLIESTDKIFIMTGSSSQVEAWGCKFACWSSIRLSSISVLVI